MHNWSEIVCDIEGSGKTLTWIAGEVGLKLGSLSDIKRGRTKQPRANVALKLLELHAGARKTRKRRRKPMRAVA